MGSSDDDCGSPAIRIGRGERIRWRFYCLIVLSFAIGGVYFWVFACGGLIDEIRIRNLKAHGARCGYSTKAQQYFIFMEPEVNVTELFKACAADIDALSRKDDITIYLDKTGVRDDDLRFLGIIRGRVFLIVDDTKLTDKALSAFLYSDNIAISVEEKTPFSAAAVNEYNRVRELIREDKKRP